MLRLRRVAFAPCDASRPDTEQLESNLCYHLRRNILSDGSSQHYPWLLPVYFDVPGNEWKLLADDGSEMTVGTTVTVRGNERLALDSLQPSLRKRWLPKERSL